jgi:basic amino acid/polyamine antiporter, APA family
LYLNYRENVRCFILDRVAQTKGRGVPTLPVVVVVGTGILLSGFSSIGELAELANIGGLTAFALTTLSVIVLRFTKPDELEYLKFQHYG